MTPPVAPAPGVSVRGPRSGTVAGEEATKRDPPKPFLDEDPAAHRVQQPATGEQADPEPRDRPRPDPDERLEDASQSSSHARTVVGDVDLTRRRPADDAHALGRGAYRFVLEELLEDLAETGPSPTASSIGERPADRDGDRQSLTVSSTA
jgi:hypothetical protein